MQSAVCTLTSVDKATKETNMAHTLGAMMGRDDSSERPMLLRYCDSRRIVVPEVKFGSDSRESISNVRIGRRFSKFEAGRTLG